MAEVAAGTRHLLRDRPLWLAVMAISYFWFLALLFQMDLVLFGSETLHASDRLVGLLMTCLSLGIGAGSMLAGRLSGDKVEIGLVPLGSIFMGVFSLGLYAARGSYAASVVMLSLLGIAAGVFFVPLNAYLQQRSESGEKGRIIATNNIYNTLGMLLATAVFYVCNDGLHISPPHIILMFGFVSLAITVYIVTVVDDFLIRFVLWMVTHTIFRIRIVGQENVPFRGPALLVSNHMSHVDGFLMGACVQRFIRFMVWKPYYQMKALNWFFRKTKAIPVGGGPRCSRSDPRGAAGTGRRARGVHFRGRRHQPHRQYPAVQARHGEDRGGPGCADHPGASGPAVGQHLQLRARPVFLEVAQAHSVSGDGFVRQSDAGEFHRA